MEPPHPGNEMNFDRPPSRRQKKNRHRSFRLPVFSGDGIDPGIWSRTIQGRRTYPYPCTLTLCCIKSVYKDAMQRGVSWASGLICSCVWRSTPSCLFTCMYVCVFASLYTSHVCTVVHAVESCAHPLRETQPRLALLVASAKGKGNPRGFRGLSLT